MRSCLALTEWGKTENLKTSIFYPLILYIMYIAWFNWSWKLTIVKSPTESEIKNAGCEEIDDYVVVVLWLEQWEEIKEMTFLSSFIAEINWENKEGFEYLESYMEAFDDCETSEDIYEEIMNWDSSAEFEAWVIAGKKAAIFILKNILWR